VNLHPPPQPEEASFDLTPMIDVVLLLIIFFMMTSQFSRTEQASLNLPAQRGDGSAAVSEHAVVLDLHPDGRVSVRGETQDIDSLMIRIGSDAKANGVPTEALDIVIRADRDAPASALSRVCAGLSRLGTRTIRLATDSDLAALGPGRGDGTQ
jgi:biopolymer transport protein ExbD